MIYCDQCDDVVEATVGIMGHCICKWCLIEALEQLETEIPCTVKKLLPTHDVQTVDGVQNVLVLKNPAVVHHYTKIGKYIVPVYAQ